MFHASNHPERLLCLSDVCLPRQHPTRAFLCRFCRFIYKTQFSPPRPFDCMQYVHDQYMFPTLAPRSVNTIETYHEKKTGIESRHPGVVVAPAVNLQMAQDGGSLDGVITSIPWTSALGSLDLASENIFNGISICRCHGEDSAMRKMAKTPERMRSALQPLLQNKDALPRLSDILPSEQQEDFWWSGVSCTLQCSDATRKAVGKDYDAGAVNFYPLYELATLTGAADADHAARDGCVWKPCVRNGMVGFFEQVGGDNPGFFLACVSSVPSLGSELMRAVKSDITGECTAGDFTDSKEIWFLENLARRNRLRCLAKAADLLQLKVFRQGDVLAHPSQAREQLVVEAVGVVYENLYVDEVAHEASVIHAKGCLDASHGVGPIPLWLGPGHDIMVLHADSALRSLSGSENDYCVFAHRSPGERLRAFPAVNLREESLANTERIEQETASLPRLNVGDIMHNMHTQQVAVTDEAARVMNIIDNFGGHVFHGLRYEEPLPLLLCPQLLHRYVVAEESMQAANVPERTRRGSKPCCPRRYGSAAIPQRDVADAMFMMRKRDSVALQDHFGYSDECPQPEMQSVVLAWDQNMTFLLARLLGDGTHGISQSNLKSLLCVRA